MSKDDLDKKKRAKAGFTDERKRVLAVPRDEAPVVPEAPRVFEGSSSEWEKRIRGFVQNTSLHDFFPKDFAVVIAGPGTTHGLESVLEATNPTNMLIVSKAELDSFPHNDEADLDGVRMVNQSTHPHILLKKTSLRDVIRIFLRQERDFTGFRFLTALLSAKKAPAWMVHGKRYYITGVFLCDKQGRVRVPSAIVFLDGRVSVAYEPIDSPFNEFGDSDSLIFYSV